MIYESSTFDKKTYDETGVFIIRDLIPHDIIKEWQDEWSTFYEEKLTNGREVHLANPVHLKEQLPEKLAKMYRAAVLVDTAKQVHGDSVALYGCRIVLKDRHSLDKVPLHQDSCYHLGNLNKCSFFVPLTHVDELNGGMSFYIGSHKCGYLGDAGEINPAGFNFTFERITPELNPGDVVIMNSHTWHESGPNVAKIDRVIADIHYQPADDPTGRELLSGQWSTDFWFTIEDPTRYFINSRILKLKNIK